jgi:hypothetical protein
VQNTTAVHPPHKYHDSIGLSINAPDFFLFDRDMRMGYGFI